MRNSPPQAVRLCDYMPPDFLIDSVALDISLHKTQTRVRAKLALRRNPKGRPDAPLMLDGDGQNVPADIAPLLALLDRADVVVGAA